ncbi:MAG: RsmE family RNA methyltransferase [Bacillota bacterium]
MQQYFIDAPISETITLNDREILHHMTRVMRMKESDTIALCGQSGACFKMDIVALNNKFVTLRRLKRLKDIKHAIDITLAQALIRKTPFELTLQKAVELGVEGFIPIETKRTVVKITQKDEDKKHARFEKIAREASEQSRRSTVPSVQRSIHINDINVESYTHVFVPYENEDTLSAKDAFKAIEPGDSVLIVIGPEGGFTDGEIDTLRNKGARVISLGPRILRSETASLYALSALSYELETR